MSNFGNGATQCAVEDTEMFQGSEAKAGRPDTVKKHRGIGY